MTDEPAVTDSSKQARKHKGLKIAGVVVLAMIGISIVYHPKPTVGTGQPKVAIKTANVTSKSNKTAARKTPGAAGTHLLHGVVVDLSDGSQSGDRGDPTCAKDTYASAPVTITNQNGQVIGSATLSNGSLVDIKPDPYNSSYILSAYCGYTFATMVPTRATFYGLKIGNNTPVEFSAAIVHSNQWTIHLKLGHPCYAVGIQTACG